MLTLVLTRHGLTDRSVPEQHLGQRIDVSLNRDGVHQADALARRLAPVRFDRVISSPLFRAQETAQIVVRGAAIETDPRLKEMDHGAWEGMTYARVEEYDRAYRRQWEADPESLACPGGESGNDVAVRVRSFLADLLAEHRAWHARASFRAATAGPGAQDAGQERRLLAVGHASANRILLCVALGVPVRDYRRRFMQDQANLTVLRWQAGAAPEEAVLVLANDVAHLRDKAAVPWSAG
jgi:broad specificity phosphatase PhoE